MAVNELIEQVLALPAEEHEMIVDAVWASRTPTSDDLAQARIAAHRIEELRSGAVQGVTHEEVMRRVRAKLG